MRRSTSYHTTDASLDGLPAVNAVTRAFGVDGRTTGVVLSVREKERKVARFATLMAAGSKLLVCPITEEGRALLNRKQENLILLYTIDPVEVDGQKQVPRMNKQL